jgi:hypothetical protein
MGTWELVDPPEGRTPVSNKWVFVKKYDKQGNLQKYKARLVAKGYSQMPGMDYNDTFAPVARMETIQALLALAVTENWEIQQMDVKGAYLNGKIKEEIYMKQPEGYEDGTDRLCHLIKSLYGLKQAGREWNEELNKQLEAHGWKPSEVDPCAYIRKTTEGIEIVIVWVDDLLLLANSHTLMNKMKNELKEIFEITDLGEPSKIVGIEIDRDREHHTITISQKQYTESILQKEGLENMNPVGMPMDPNIKLNPSEGEPGDGHNNYASLIGSLMYLAVATRPDIAYAVYRLGSYMSNPNMSHWSAAKRILRYLSGTRDYGITYRANKPEKDENHFLGYSDASYANNDDLTSVSGNVFLMSGGAISWSSKKQNNVSLSTTESEYIALADATREIMWLRNLFKGLGYEQPKPTILYGDNSGSLAIAKNPQYHKRTKHFDTKHHYIRQKVKTNEVEVLYCPTSNMTADIFTKALPKPKHQLHVAELGLTSTT